MQIFELVSWLVALAVVKAILVAAGVAVLFWLGHKLYKKYRPSK